ncbi:DUF6069 family protein [Sphaerisporangium sp. NPDC051017]|uniref:DUF6069 family protein n=1 Tax=Sphaerisporangium sp. NPDC051017 TaxID=3154636 RepID=UPI0034135F99
MSGEITSASASSRGQAVRRASSVAGAAAAALALWTLAVPVGGIALDVRLGGAVQPVGAGAVAAAALGAGLAAWALLAALERLLARPRRAWTIIAVAVLVLSLAGPLGATGTAALVTLAALHLIVGAILIPGLGGSARRP